MRTSKQIQYFAAIFCTVFVLLTIFLFVTSIVNRKPQQEVDVVDGVLVKNGCTWDNPEITDNGTFSFCMTETSGIVKKEQEVKFEEYLSMLRNFPDDGQHILGAPYDIGDAISATVSLRDAIDDYVEKKCTAVVSTISSASGGDMIRAECEIGIYQNNIDFLNERIRTFEEYSLNLENLIRQGVNLEV